MSTDLTQRAYEQLRRATATYREELVVRLCGEVGLRAAEVTRLRPDDVTGRGGDGGTRYFLTVREGDGETRTAYMPSAVAHDFWQYVRSNGVGDGECVVGISERRVQMLVGEVGERAADHAGRATLESVTPSTLRRYFARRLLVEHGVDARVVATVGGWSGVDALLSGLDDPTREEIASAFGRLEQRERGLSGRLSRVVETVAAADDALLAANSRGEIDQRVPEVLAGDCYEGVWLTEEDPHTGGVTVRVHAGESPDRFAGTGETSIITRALQTGRPFVGPGSSGPTSDSEGRGLLAAVPLSHGETTEGALVVRSTASDAFDDPERTLLRNLGQRIAFTTAAIERRQVLHGETVLEVTFRYDDREAALVGLAADLDCTLTLDGIVPGDADSLLCFVTVRGTAVEDALEAIGPQATVADGRLIERYSDGGLVELTVVESSPLLTVTDRGGTVTDLQIEDGTATLVAELAPDADVRTLHERLTERFPSAELRSKQSTVSRPDDMGESVRDRLTEKQRAVLEAAFHAGYFEWPRGSTAEELAESMNVSAPTLHNHLRKAQQKLLEATFEDE